MKKKIIYYLCFLMAIAIQAVAAPLLTITDYQPIYIPCYTQQHQLKIAIRMYYISNQLHFVLVNPYNFSTSAVPAIQCAPRAVDKGPGYYSEEELKATPYVNALMRDTSPPYELQNYGVAHGQFPTNGFFLTVDMCPSSKKFEAKFFQKLVALSDASHQPFPVALSMSGLWIIGHPKEFQWLVQQKTAKKLDITWINHTFSHIYYPGLPLQENFMLDKQSNTDQEILELEKILLQNHQVPSVFFRFPGLVADKKLVLKLRKYGLIPISSDAWLAKGETAKPGSIILVHGNSNEPLGIELIMPMLNNPANHFLPLVNVFLKPAN